MEDTWPDAKTRQIFDRRKDNAGGPILGHSGAFPVSFKFVLSFTEMPPDTTHIPVSAGQPTATDSVNFVLPATDEQWQEQLQQHLDSLEMAYYRHKEAESPRYPLPQGTMFLILLGIICYSFYLFIIRPERIRNKLKLQSSGKKAAALASPDTRYDEWLTEYNPYYKSLPADMKLRFLDRVREFMAAKDFRFHAMVEEEYIPVLISGAAVQLAFGLRNYKMDYFNVIHVMRREYVLNIDRETYYGHVSPNGIHISWNSFLKGYGDYTDSVNVGLHEFAHALQMDSSLGEEDEHDIQFKSRLSEFHKEGRPVFMAMRKGRSHLLDDYAGVNFDEFWAVSVESFFENPLEFKEKLPSLYEEMKLLLNQDPEIPGTFLDPEIA